MLVHTLRHQHIKKKGNKTIHTIRTWTYLYLCEKKGKEKAKEKAKEEKLFKFSIHNLNNISQMDNLLLYKQKICARLRGFSLSFWLVPHFATGTLSHSSVITTYSLQLSTYVEAIRIYTVNANDKQSKTPGH